jgi:hypothetical protein
VANGDIASVNWVTFTDGFNSTVGSLTVDRGGPTKPQTAMSYFVVQESCDPETFNCLYDLVAAGSGLIPNRDLSGSGKQLRLNTNTAGNPNFFVYAGSSGVIAAQWNANGLYQTTMSGTTSERFGGFTERHQGSSTYWSANTTGNVVGIPIPAIPNAQIGTSHNVTIDIYH